MSNLRAHVCCFGRFNPLTIGHVTQFDAMLRVMGELNCLGTIYTSNTHDCKTNPLTIDQKLEYMHRALPTFLIKEAKDPFFAVADIKQTFPSTQQVIYFAGSDYFDNPVERSMFERLEKYGNTHQLEITPYISGHRDDRISGTLARQCVQDNDFAAFCQLSPIGIGNVTTEYVRNIFDNMRNSILS